MKEAVTKVIDMQTQDDFHGTFQKVLERYNRCIAAVGDYFEGYLSFMRVLSIKVPIRKKNLETYLTILVCSMESELNFWSFSLNSWDFVGCCL